MGFEQILTIVRKFVPYFRDEDVDKVKDHSVAVQGGHLYLIPAQVTDSATNTRVGCLTDPAAAHFRANLAGAKVLTKPGSGCFLLLAPESTLRDFTVIEDQPASFSTVFQQH